MKAAVSVRVPGKVMLCGEYSVLTGGRALAATLDRHLAVRVRPKAGLGGIYVASDLWDEPRFVHAAESAYQDPLLAAVRQGMELFRIADLEVRIDSELDIKLGLGSSSALRLGVLLALREMSHLAAGQAYSGDRHDFIKVAREAYLLQKEAQSQASGYDVATQCVGGLVDFEKGANDAIWPQFLTVLDGRFQNNLPQVVHLYGGGSGAPTTALLRSTLTWLKEQGRVAALDKANQQLREAFLAALATPENQGVLRSWYAATRKQRQLFADAPAYPQEIATRLTRLPGCDETWSFKTTGAGGEDALLLLGPRSHLADADATLKQHGWYRLDVGFESAGARVTRGAMSHG